MSPILVIAIACIAAFAVGKLLFRADERVEDRRRHAAQIAVEMKTQGLEHIPELLIDYSVGDYSGIMSRLKSWYELLRQDTQRRHFFDTFLKTQLKLALEDPQRRQEVLDAVDQYRDAERAKLDRLVEKTVAERLNE